MRVEEIITFLVGFASLILPIIAFFQKPYNRSRIIFSLFSFQGSLWAFTIVLFRISQTVQIAKLNAQLIYIIGSLVPVLFVLFVSIFVNKFYPRFIRLLILVSVTFFIYSILFSDLFISSVQLNDRGNAVSLGPLNYAWVAWFGILMSLGLIRLLQTYRLSVGLKRTQLRYIILSFTPPLFFSVPFNLVLPILGNYDLIWIGPNSLILMMAIMGYAIYAHRVMGLRFVLGRMLYYSVLFLIPWLFVNLILFANNFLESFSPTNSILAKLFLSAMFVILFRLSDRYVRYFFDRYIVYRKFNPLRAVADLIKQTTTELNLDKVVAAFISMLKTSLQIENIGVILFDSQSKKILFKKAIGFDLNQIDNRVLFEIVHLWDWQEMQGRKSEILIAEELSNNIGIRSHDEQYRLEKILSYMKEDNIALVLPLNRKVQLNGIIFISAKEKGESFTYEEIGFLESIIGTVSVAAGRALLYQEVKNSAQTLQEKVDEATRELQDKITKLEEASEKERSMIDILGHELRTPMSIIRGSFSFYRTLIQKKLSGETVDEVKIGEYTERISENIEREVKLIEIFLSSTKIDQDELEVYRQEVDAVDVINTAIVGQEKNAQEKHLSLLFKPPEAGFPKMFADPTRIQEVVDNILSNSVKYTDTGHIEISLTADDQFVTIHILDTGPGIPKDAIPHLGQKFFRVNQYLEGSKMEKPMVRAGGTGLGLYVTFGIVKAHDGKIVIDSEVGKGTTLHISIPRHAGQQVERSETGAVDRFEKLRREKEGAG